MIPIRKVEQNDLVVATFLGAGISPNDTAFTVHNLVGESGLLVVFDNDNTQRYIVLMKDIIKAVVDNYESLVKTVPEGPPDG